MPSRRHNSEIEYSPRKPANTILIFSSAEYFLRVARRMLRTCCSAVSAGPDFCVIFASFKGYDEPEILRYQTTPLCLMVADGGQPKSNTIANARQVIPKNLEAWS
jgi:hypothetical protein